MRFDDAVYGQQKVKKEVFKDIIQSEPLQRLKGIHQSGPGKYFIEKTDYTRFNHSLGVYFLLRKNNASIEEQIAGLLHDTPHTAFSHLADFVFENQSHDYHDRFLEKIIYSSEIPEIVESHGYDIEYIMDESNFPLLEPDLPDLCADRIDYFLRTMQVDRRKSIDSLLETVSVDGDEFVLEEKELGEKYALDFIETDRKTWASPIEVAVTEKFSEIIRRAFEIDLLREEELFKDDKYVYRKIKNSDDPIICEKLDLLNSDFSIELVEKSEADISVKTKARFVDPKVLVGKNTVRVSEYSDRVRKEIDSHKNKVRSGYNIKFRN